MAKGPRPFAMALGEGTMKAEEIAPITRPGGNPEQRPDHTHQKHKSFAVAKPAEIDSEIIKTPSPDRIRFNKLEATNSQSQQIAQQIRQVNQSMETIDSHLSEMRAMLEYIVKIYPPYPPGSTERIEALRQFSALRKMIDQVTRPIGNDSITNILSAADGPAGSVELAISSGEHQLHIGRQPLHPGRGGLDIPDISANASDGQISNALDRTIAAQTTFQARHQSFIAEANRIISEVR